MEHRKTALTGIDARMTLVSQGLKEMERDFNASLAEVHQQLEDRISTSIGALDDPLAVRIPPRPHPLPLRPLTRARSVMPLPLLRPTPSWLP